MAQRCLLPCEQVHHCLGGVAPWENLHPMVTVMAAWAESGGPPSQGRWAFPASFDLVITMGEPPAGPARASARRPLIHWDIADPPTPTAAIRARLSSVPPSHRPPFARGTGLVQRLAALPPAPCRGNQYRLYPRISSPRSTCPLVRQAGLPPSS
jgi:hypothetical protein